MKFFLDRNRTLLPRIDTINLLTRVLVLISITWYALWSNSTNVPSWLLQGVLITYILHLIVFWAATSGRFDVKLAYLSAIVYDLLMVPLLILSTGGIRSPFYLLIFMTVSVAAYVLVFRYAVTAAVLAIAGFVLAISADMEPRNFFDVDLRIAFIVAYFLAISYCSVYLRRSEHRVLQLFNTLNRRTSELEKSQAHLQVIYENSRVLASILDTEGVIKGLVRLMTELLQLSYYAIIFRNQQGGFYYRARVRSREINYRPAPVDPERMQLVAKVYDSEQAIRIKDLGTRDDYQPLHDEARSAMIVPLASRGVISGVLTAESSQADRFSERDLQMLCAVAQSAALALDNAELHKRTEELTTFDELTQTYNYRYFVQKLDEEKRRAFRYNLPLSLVMVDIDFFKKLNDTCGHENGNRVLRQLSQILKGCIRDVDIFARYGGEEFAVILPQTPLMEASRIGERIRSQVEAHSFELLDGSTIRVTVSVGVSSFPENGQSPQQLVNVADQALYRAKGEGRNLVRSI